jgi:hypothetical protein
LLDLGRRKIDGTFVAPPANRLIRESSPYLRQHAHNPVDWYPWGPDALERARRENKPILLSIGYSACHWCHVMERESFEDEATARVMNEHFVNIKVDREERPDLDHIYMTAVQALTGRGGWPLTVFLTPAGEPFYGGTYFPPEDRHGMPGFRRVLHAIAQAYREKPAEVQRSAAQLLAALHAEQGLRGAALPDATLVLDAADAIARAYDPRDGGFGPAPKFPNPPALELFLRAYRQSGESRFLEMVTHTLTRMARGGIYDQLGGGFHRYSVDAHWLVPHFEKMLYDNAQLVPLYLAAYQLTGDLAFATIARETLDYLLREMRDPAGGFYSTQDADSEGEEGKFFLWDRAEVQEILGEETAEIVCRYWDISDAGNFEHRNILHVTLDVAQLGALFKRDVGELRLLLGEARAKLFAVRARRVKPARDEKILTAWNGLAISAFAKAAELFDEEADRRAALDAVAFVQTHLQRGDRLLSTYAEGSGRLNAHLDDYAFFVAALLDVFETFQDPSHLEQAILLAEAMLRHFWDAEHGGFFFTSDDHEALIVRSKPSFDGSIPAGNAVAVRNLLRLHCYTGNAVYLDRAEATLRLFAEPMRQQPFGFATLLGALDFHTQRPYEIAVVAPPGTPETGLLLEQIRRVYLPNRTLRVFDSASTAARPPWLAGKGLLDGHPTVYVCHNMTCSLPVTTWPELEPLLRPPTPPAVA